MSQLGHARAQTLSDREVLDDAAFADEMYQRWESARQFESDYPAFSWAWSAGSASIFDPRRRPLA